MANTTDHDTATAQLELQRARLADLRAEMATLDGELVEANRAVAQAIAEGTDPGALTQTRRELQLRLDDLHAALPELEGLVRDAERRVVDAQVAEAVERRRAALAAELDAAREVERDTLALAEALKRLREAERASYGEALAAKLETGVHYRRRHGLLQRFLATHVGDLPPVPNAHREPVFADRLAQLLPPTPVPEAVGD